jgi:6-pyruvoyltetrahydropterin/6-carboxytetrahydropterin synthase
MQITLEISKLNDGLAFDFVELKKIVKESIIQEWDHQLINDYIENPSAEHMCIYAWEKLSASNLLGEKLYEIKIWETPTSCATYRGSNGSF